MVDLRKTIKHTTMEKIELKNLPFTESDFVLVREYIERSCGHEWQMIRYDMRPQLIGVTPEITAKEIYEHYYAVRDTSNGHIFINVEKGTKTSQIIEDMNRYYHVWQLGKHFGGNHTEAEAHEIFDAYSKYFDNREFPAYREAWKSTEQEQAAAELGLGKRLMCYISRQDDKLYVSAPEVVYSTPDGIDIFIHVDGTKVRLSLSPRFDTGVVGKSLTNNHRERTEFERQFEEKEPQRFSLGKCTTKKRDAWFAYIKAYYDSAEKFFTERNDAIGKAAEKLKSAGFTILGEDSRQWRCHKGYFDCVATICDDGKIHTDISISYTSNVREEVFGI